MNRAVLIFTEWQQRECAALQQRTVELLRTTRKRQLNHVQQQLVNARLDCIRDGHREYEREIAQHANDAEVG